MRPPFEGIHRRILITRALSRFVGCDPPSRVCPTYSHPSRASTIMSNVPTLPTFNIHGVQCKMYIGRAPQDNIRIGRAVGTAEGGRERNVKPTCLYFCAPTSVYLNHCRARCIRATPLWTVNWTQGVKTAVRQTPYRAWGVAEGSR